MERELGWEGCGNVRDLGGLPAAGGRTTRRGALVRADGLDQLTAAGWAALEAHGVRTVIDLRNDDELGADGAPRPAGLTTLHLPLDGVEDREFWDRWSAGPVFGTPLYYGPFLERFADRAARTVAAVTAARPGGVVVHCGRGRDRTGLVAILVLSLVGVAPDAIAADYARSEACLTARAAVRGDHDEGPVLTAFLERQGTDARGAVRALLEAVDVEAVLRAGGLTAGAVAALRARLLES